MMCLLTRGSLDNDTGVLPVHAPVQTLVAVVLEPDSLQPDGLYIDGLHYDLQFSHHRDHLLIRSCRGDPRHPGCVSVLMKTFRCYPSAAVVVCCHLSTDVLPGQVQHGPVVEHEVPEASTLNPGPHRSVAQRLLEENLKQENISNMKIFQNRKIFQRKIHSKT